MDLFTTYLVSRVDNKCYQPKRYRSKFKEDLENLLKHYFKELEKLTKYIFNSCS